MTVLLNRRLSLATLASLPGAVQRPRYDPRTTGIGVVHLGVGNFHRAHQAVAFDDALNRGESNWGISGVSLRSSAVADALGPQDHLYTLLERDAGQTRARVIGSLRDLTVFPCKPGRVMALLADDNTRIISLTVTEKGYLPVADEALDAPVSTVGVLLRGLRQRFQSGAAPVTLLSCDNLSGNGAALRRALLAQAERLDEPALLRWLEQSVSTPDSMVDRIVPATGNDEREQVRTICGVDDAWPVATEPFTQWIVADEFAAGRPAWDEAVGIRLVSDVVPYEQMKLGLLNAAHSAMAYLGLCAGHETVAEAAADSALRPAIERLWRNELAPALAANLQSEIGGYTAALMRRFANPSLRHRLAQIACDGSQKIPLRWLPALRAARLAGRPTPQLYLALAAWLHCLRVPALRAQFTDPSVDALSAHLGGDAHVACARLFAQQEIFGAIGKDQALVSAVSEALRNIEAGRLFDN